MKEVTISDFRSRLAWLLEKVQRTGKPIRITRRGKPLAEIGPAWVEPNPEWIGSMKDEIEIRGDIVSSATDVGEGEGPR